MSDPSSTHPADNHWRAWRPKPLAAQRAPLRDLAAKAKDEQRRKIAADVENFLENGGAIQTVPMGAITWVKS